jgi:hypothetical protein
MPLDSEGRAVSNTLPSPAGRVEGERRRDAALKLHAERCAALVRRGQRALLLRLLDAGTATADDVRDAVELPAGVGPRCFGAVPLPLAELGIISAAGYTPTRRPEGHARPITVWELADRAAALAWIDTHPEKTDREPAALVQRGLFDRP